MIILRNNSHGGIIRVCMGIFTAALRNKIIRQILKKNTSPYFYSVTLVIWPLTLMKRTHFSELSISTFSTFLRKDFDALSCNRRVFGMENDRFWRTVWRPRGLMAWNITKVLQNIFTILLKHLSCSYKVAWYILYNRCEKLGKNGTYLKRKGSFVRASRSVIVYYSNWLLFHKEPNRRSSL